MMCKVRGIRFLFEAKKDGYVSTNDKGIHMRIEGGMLDLRVYYDYKEDVPLRLTAEAAEGDQIEMFMLPYRLELRVNGKVEDEEWPVGNCFYNLGDPLASNMVIHAEPTDYEEEYLPDVVGTFSDAEGWQPDKNVFVGDCMPYSTDGEYHVVYLKDRRHHLSSWGLAAHQWEHISTKDFTVWRIHPSVVKITEQWEGSICTGSWIKHGELQYMFYTVRTANGMPLPIMRSVSTDGYHYEKDREFTVHLSERYDRYSTRDPKVILGDDGSYHMFLTTALAREKNGCLVHLTSRDLNSWQEEEPIYVASDASQPECPDYIKYQGFYYLIFSHKGKGQYLYSDEPFSNWRTPKCPAIPCGYVPKGAIWDDKIIFTGFQKIGTYAGTMTFLKAHAGEDHELVFE